MELCLPGQLSCIKNEIKKTEMDNLDCPDACNGIFADLRIDKDGMKTSSDFKSILDDYIRYKENYVQNIEFNSSFDNASYGGLK